LGYEGDENMPGGFLRQQSYGFNKRS